MLAEAIADAKALKETAIANAKAALEEAFEPRLKSMLSAKLQEMASEDELEEAKDTTSEEMNEGEDINLSDTSDDAEEVMKGQHGNIAASNVNEESMSEEDLDEILAELDGMDEAEEEAEVEVDAEEEMEGEDEMEDEDIDLEEMSEDDLKSFIEDVIRDMVGSGELEAGEEFEVEDDMEVEDEDIDIDAEEEVDEITMESELDERKKYGGNKGDVPAAKRGDKKDTAEEEGVEDYKKRMKEEIDELKTELYEVNLLNAKLLYTNKIFRAKNLSENHKVKVLEAFDKAETVKEVKLVFETLNGELKEKTTIKENLGSASKPAGVAPKAPIVEVDAQVARWQKLAGLK